MSNAVSTSCTISHRLHIWRCNVTKEWSNSQLSSRLLLPPDLRTHSPPRLLHNTNDRTRMIGTTVNRLPPRIQIDPLLLRQIGTDQIMLALSLHRDTSRGNSISLWINVEEHCRCQLSISVLKRSKVDQLSLRMQLRDNLNLRPPRRLYLSHPAPTIANIQTPHPSIPLECLSIQILPQPLRISPPTSSLNPFHLQSLLRPLSTRILPSPLSRKTRSLKFRLHSPIRTSQLQPLSTPCSTSTSKLISSLSYHPPLPLLPPRAARTRSHMT